MPGIASTVDVNTGRIYAGVPTAPGPDLDYTEIAGIKYSLIPGTNILRGEGGPSYFLGKAYPTIIRYDPSIEEWQVTTPGSPIRINGPGPRSPEKQLAGNITALLPSGDAVRLSVDNVQVSPQDRRLAIIPDRNGEPITVEFPDTMSEQELQSRFGSDITHFLSPDEARQRGVIRHLYANERALIEEALMNVNLPAEGYNDTFSGAAAYLADKAAIDELHVFNVYHVTK